MRARLVMVNVIYYVIPLGANMMEVTVNTIKKNIAIISAQFIL